LRSREGAVKLWGRAPRAKLPPAAPTPPTNAQQKRPSKPHTTAPTAGSSGAGPSAAPSEKGLPQSSGPSQLTPAPASSAARPGSPIRYTRFTPRAASHTAEAYAEESTAVGGAVMPNFASVSTYAARGFVELLVTKNTRLPAPRSASTAAPAPGTGVAPVHSTPSQSSKKVSMVERKAGSKARVRRGQAIAAGAVAAMVNAGPLCNASVYRRVVGVHCVCMERAAPVVPTPASRTRDTPHRHPPGLGIHMPAVGLGQGM